MLTPIVSSISAVQRLMVVGTSTSYLHSPCFFGSMHSTRVFSSTLGHSPLSRDLLVAHNKLLSVTLGLVLFGALFPWHANSPTDSLLPRSTLNSFLVFWSSHMDLTLWLLVALRLFFRSSLGTLLLCSFAVQVLLLSYRCAIDYSSSSESRFSSAYL